MSTKDASTHAARIFISYRREDSELAASRLADELRQHFAHDQVFQDFASIDPGADFIAAVQRGLDTCAAVVVVIGANWLSVVDRDGRRRIDVAEDWVRHEVGESLRRPGVRVFPVLVGGADMPGVTDLPVELQPLTRRQAFPLTVRHWPKDVAELVEHLRRVPGLDRPASPRGPARWLSKTGSRKALAGLAIAFAALAALAWWLFMPPGSPELPAKKPVEAQPRHDLAPLADKANSLLQRVDRQRGEIAEAARNAASELDLIKKRLKTALADDDKRKQQVALFEAQERLAIDEQLSALYRKEIEGPQGIAALAARLDEANAAAKAGDLSQAKAQYTAVIAALTTLQDRPAALREQVVTQRDQSIQPPLQPKAEPQAKPAPKPEPGARTPSKPAARSEPPRPVTDLSEAESTRVAKPARKPGEVFRDCSDCPEMVVVPAGSFLMGSPESESGRGNNKRPQHTVTIAQAFAVGKYEVTFDEWDACVAAGSCKQEPGDEGWGRGRRPVIKVSWDDAQAYLSWLTQKTGKGYRLLSEAEWEYAARAGSTAAYPWGHEPGTNWANFRHSGSQWSGQQTAPVDSFAPNGFGLYNMIGNVWEWTQDCWNDSYAGAPMDGLPWLKGECGRRVVRGGSWYNYPGYARAAFRDRMGPGLRLTYLGFRLARTL